MEIEIKLPELGDGIESGDVLEVFVSEGDHVDKDQDIVEIESDKSTAPIPSTHRGVVSKIHVGEGDTVAVGGPLVTLTVEEEAKTPDSSQDDQSPAQSSKAAEPQQDEAPPPRDERPADTKSKPAAEKREESTAKGESKAAPPKRPSSPSPSPPPSTSRVEAKPVSTAAKSTSDASTVIPAGPAVRRFAREVGVDLNKVSGSGQGGRITRDDVLDAVRKAGQTQATTQGEKPPAAKVQKEADETEVKLPGEAGQDKWGPVRIERLTKIRKTIAAQMHKSWETAPRVTNFDDADITELERLRQASKGDYAAKGLRLTTMPFVIKAVAMSLKAHPAVNAALDMENEEIHYKQYYNVGIAVDTDRGLVVPSLRNADDMSIPEIARGLSEIADRARSGSFSIDDLRGSTFTISNLGAIGGTYSTPIINVPEVAILLVGRSRKLPVVNDNDQIVARLMMPLSLSYDHRLVDGATAARFLNDVIAYLEAPSRLLLSL